MIFGIVFMILVIVGLITILRPIFYPNPKFPEQRVKKFLLENELIYKDYDTIIRKRCSEIHFSGDVHPFYNSFFFGVACYKVNAENNEKEKIEIFVRWYQSYTFNFRSKIYYFIEGN